MSVGIGTAMAGFSGLEVRIEGQAWTILLRRADFSADESFKTRHGATLGARELAHYLPNWKRLNWAEIPDNYVTRSQSWARDMPYQVNVQGAFGGSLTHAQVRAAFLAFMA